MPLIVHPTSTCDVCYENFGPQRSPYSISRCGHIFCGSCLRGQKSCPMCRSVIHSNSVKKLRVEMQESNQRNISEEYLLLRRIALAENALEDSELKQDVEAYIARVPIRDQANDPVSKNWSIVVEGSLRNKDGHHESRRHVYAPRELKRHEPNTRPLAPSPPVQDPSSFRNHSSNPRPRRYSDAHVPTNIFDTSDVLLLDTSHHDFPPPGFPSHPDVQVSTSPEGTCTEVRIGPVAMHFGSALGFGGIGEPTRRRRARGFGS